MKIRNLDSNGDWTFGKGLQNYLTAQAAIEEDIETYLNLWVGNCYWALNQGVNWASLFDKNQMANLLNALQSAILGRNGVVAVKQLSAVADPQTRLVTVSYIVQTIYSQSFQNSIVVGANPNA